MARPVSVFDQYTALMHLAGIDPDRSRAVEPPSWLPDDHHRRREAYRILSTYITNSARFNNTAMDPTDQRGLREYGDPRLLVDRIVAGILGSGVVPTIRGATQPPLERPELPPRPDGPDDLAEPGDEVERLIAAVELDVWETNARRIVDDWAQAWADYPSLEARQAWLEEWWETEQVASKVYDLEANGAVPLGDGVLVLGWSTERQRPTVTVYEPDAYIPVLDSANAGDFPERVHLAWEYEDPDDSHRYLRRITYDLVDTDAYEVPWDDQPATVVCELTDATFRLDVTGSSWPTLDEASATYRLNEDGEPLDRFPIGIDFIPVIHVPNTPSTTEHFGTSSITNVLQLLDDLVSVDTDTQTAGSIAGNPTLGAAGVNAGDIQLQAGKILSLPVEGRLFPIDMSGALDAMRRLGDDMLERLSVNSQVPGVVMGRVSGDQVPSGVALSLSFAPFEQLVAVLRLTRIQKYGLMVKMAQRLAQVGGILEDGPTPIVDLGFASTIPSDQAAAIDGVARLLEAGGIPRYIGLTILKQAGLPVDDIDAAVQQIQREDTAGGKDIADAMQNEAAAADYYGIDLPRPADTDNGGQPLEGAATLTDLPGPLEG